MEPTFIRLGIMDSSRPAEVVSLPARHLRGVERLKRALGRSAIITFGGLVLGNLALIMVPFPHVHLCLIPVSLVLGPIVAVMTWRHRALLCATDVPCPRCRETVRVPEGLPGWPARFNCVHCGIMVQLDLAR